MSAGTTSSGTTPMRASRSRRRGLAEASINRTSGSTRRPSAAGHEAVGDAALGEVGGGNFDEDFVTSKPPNPVLANLAGGVDEDFMAVFEFHGSGSGSCRERGVSTG